MARIKGGLNAKKKHRRILKLAKGYMGARSKQYRIAKQRLQKALDRKNQRCCKNQWSFIQQSYARS